MNYRSAILPLCGLLLGLYLFSKPVFENKKAEIVGPESEVLFHNPEDVNPSNLVLTEDQTSSVDQSKTTKDRPGNGDALKDKKKLDANSKHQTFNAKTQLRFTVIDDYAVAAQDILLGQPKDKTLSGGIINFSDDTGLWPNGEVTYAFDAKLNEVSKQRALSAMKTISGQTAIRFIEYTGYEKDFIVFSPSDKLCASYVGKVGGAQPVFLKEACQTPEVIHELMHALGFIHEHQRDIRDQYLHVQFENIQKDKLINFDIFPESFQSVYRNSKDIDLNSLMIYSSYAFSLNPKVESIRIKNSQEKIQDNQSLSEADIQKIDDLYFRKF